MQHGFCLDSTTFRKCGPGPLEVRKGLHDGLLTYRTRKAQKSGDKKAFEAAFKMMIDYRASVEDDNVCAWAWFADTEDNHAGWPHKTQKYR